MLIEQEYKVDKQHRRAFRDVCTAPVRHIPLPFLAAGCLYKAYSAYTANTAEYSVIALFWCVVVLIPCVFAIVDLIRIAIAAAADRVWRYTFGERTAVQHWADGKTAAFPYRTVRILRENESFLRIVSRKNTAVIRKDELSAETLDGLTAAIAAECPKAKRKSAKHRNLLCTVVTVLTTAVVLAYSVVCLIPIADGYAFAGKPYDAAVACYTEAHSISQVGCWTSSAYHSSDRKSWLLYVGNSEHRMCPTDVYYVSFYDREWHAREVTEADVPLEFRTDTALVRVIKINECCLLEVRCAEDTDCRTEALLPQRAWGTEKCNNGEYDKIRTRQCPEGIQTDSVLYLDGEAYPIGQMLAGN